jgi:hypothetical protein
MDEFFDFENAVHSTGRLDKPMIAPYDINIALAQRAQPDDPLAQINQFADPLPQDQLNLASPDAVQDIAITGRSESVESSNTKVGASFSREALRILRA